MKKARSHVHERDYFGDRTAEPVIDWLNSKRRPEPDVVADLLELNGQLPLSFQELLDYFAEIVRRSKFATAPVLLGVRPNHWKIDWRLVGNMDAEQGLAFGKLIHLAEQGLLGRIRKCAKKECGRWFYARFEHQKFHAQKCQVEAFRSDPQWKEQRREYMKQLRQEKKLREQKWLRSPKRKGKR